MLYGALFTFFAFTFFSLLLCFTKWTCCGLALLAFLGLMKASHVVRCTCHFFHFNFFTKWTCYGLALLASLGLMKAPHVGWCTFHLISTLAANKSTFCILQQSLQFAGVCTISKYIGLYLGHITRGPGSTGQEFWSFHVLFPKWSFCVT